MNIGMSQMNSLFSCLFNISFIIEMVFLCKDCWFFKIEPNVLFGYDWFQVCSYKCWVTKSVGALSLDCCREDCTWFWCRTGIWPGVDAIWGWRHSWPGMTLNWGLSRWSLVKCRPAVLTLPAKMWVLLWLASSQFQGDICYIVGAFSCTKGLVTFHWSISSDFGITLKWTYLPSNSPFDMLATLENWVSWGRGWSDMWSCRCGLSALFLVLNCSN